MVKRIIKITEKEHSNNNLDKKNVWKWTKLKSGKNWPLSKWIRINTSSPYKRARALIRKNNK